MRHMKRLILLQNPANDIYPKIFFSEGAFLLVNSSQEVPSAYGYVLELGEPSTGSFYAKTQDGSVLLVIGGNGGGDPPVMFYWSSQSGSYNDNTFRYEGEFLDVLGSDVTVDEISLPNVIRDVPGEEVVFQLRQPSSPPGAVASTLTFTTDFGEYLLIGPVTSTTWDIAGTVVKTGAMKLYKEDFSYEMLMCGEDGFDYDIYGYICSTDIGGLLVLAHEYSEDFEDDRMDGELFSVAFFIDAETGVVTRTDDWMVPTSFPYGFVPLYDNLFLSYPHSFEQGDNDVQIYQVTGGTVSLVGEYSWPPIATSTLWNSASQFTYDSARNNLWVLSDNTPGTTEFFCIDTTDFSVKWVQEDEIYFTLDKGTLNLDTGDMWLCTDGPPDNNLHIAVVSAVDGSVTHHQVSEEAMSFPLHITVDVWGDKALCFNIGIDGLASASFSIFSLSDPPQLIQDDLPIVQSQSYDPYNYLVPYTKVPRDGEGSSILILGDYIYKVNRDGSFSEADFIAPILSCSYPGFYGDYMILVEAENFSHEDVVSYGRSVRILRFED